MDIEAIVTALEELTAAHKRLNGTLCDHLTYSTPVTDDDLRGLVGMARDVAGAIQGVVRAVAPESGGDE